MPELNPYNYVKPIGKIQFFAGRETVIRDIQYYLDLARSQSQFVNIAIIGQRGIGKTSLLNVVLKEGRKRNFLVANMDLDEKKVSDTIEFYKEFYMAILEAGSRQFNIFGGLSGKGLLASFKKLVQGLEVKVEAPLNLGSIYLSKNLGKLSISDISDASLTSDLARIRQECLSSGIPCICVLIDEANLLQLNKVILQKMRNIFQRMDNYLLVLSGTEDLLEELSSVFSPIQRFFFRIMLKPFTFSEIIDAIMKPLRAINSRVEPPDPVSEFAKDIHIISGGHPYEVNLICHFVYKHASKSKTNRLILSREILEEVAEQKRRLKDFKVLYESLTQPQRELLNLIAAVREPASDWDLARLKMDFSVVLTDEERVKKRRDEYLAVLQELEKNKIVTWRNVSWKRIYSFSDPWFQMYVKYAHAIPAIIGKYQPWGILYKALCSCTDQIITKISRWMAGKGINTFQRSFRSNYSDDGTLTESGFPYVEGVNKILFNNVRESIWYKCHDSDNLNEVMRRHQEVRDRLMPLFDKSEYELLPFINLNEFSFKSIFAGCRKDNKQAKEVFYQVCDYLSKNW